MRRWACGTAGLALLLGGCIATEEQERVRAYNQDGVFLFQRSDYRDARESFQAALALQPNDPALTYNLGECCDRLGDWPKAEGYYRECLRLEPKHAECRHALVELLTRTGRQGDAHALIAAWMAEDPRAAGPYAEDGWLFHHSGDLPSAQARLHQAIEIDPHNRQALTELALVYEAMQRPDRALVLYERVVESDPTNMEVTNRINFLLTSGAGRPHPE